MTHKQYNIQVTPLCFRWMAPLRFPKLIQINYEVMLRMKQRGFCQIWYRSNQYF